MKQNFGLDGSSADFTIGKGKVVAESKISFVIIEKKGWLKISCAITIGGLYLLLCKLRASSVDFFKRSISPKWNQLL